MRFTTLLFTLLFCSSIQGFCQTDSTRTEEPVPFAQEMPVYPGGDAQMQADIRANLSYPKEEFENKIQGRVIISFIVEKDGTITNVKTLKGIPNGPNLSKAAEEAVLKLKKFSSPAKIHDKPVRMSMNIPVVFSLN